MGDFAYADPNQQAAHAPGDDFMDAAQKFGTMMRRATSGPIKDYPMNMQAADIAGDRMTRKNGGQTVYPEDQPEGYPAPTRYR